MQHRVVGAIVVAVGLYFGFTFVRAFVNSAEYIENFVGLGNFLDQPIPDPANLLLHWRIAYGMLALFSGLGVFAGVAMFFLQRWSWLVIAASATACALLGIVGMVSGYSRYGFERSGLLSYFALLVLAVSAMLAYRKWNHKQTHVTNA